MKEGVHPQYHQVTFKCACGGTFIAGSTLVGDEFSTEICSNCHPFYTGKQKLLDSSGRVEKFKAKIKKAQEKKEKAEEEKAPKKRAEKEVKIAKKSPKKKTAKAEKVEEVKEQDKK